MLIFETEDNDFSKFTVEGENRPLSFHYDNEFMTVTINNKQGEKLSVNLNHEDLVNLAEELTNYLVIIETKMDMRKYKK